MPLQTRQASRAVRNGQEFFRLLQELESGGDIYEIDASVKALCLGPQSDLANLDVFFFDEQSPDSIDQISLAVGNPVIGRIDARLATQYPTTELAARILVTARDPVDNTFVPSSFSTGDSDFVAGRPLPRIDLFAYLSDPSGYAPLRDDRLYSFPFISTASPADAFYILPYYGRRYGHVEFTNLQASPQVYTITVLGINLVAGVQAAGSVDPGANRARETALGVLDVVSGSTGNLIITQADGLFDLLTVQIEGTSGFLELNSSLAVTVSDRIGG